MNVDDAIWHLNQTPTTPETRWIVEALFMAVNEIQTLQKRLDRIENARPGDLKMIDEYDTLEHLQHLQTAIYVAVGGGMTGIMYAEHPQSARIDDRAGRRPYKAKDIEAIRRQLVETAERLGLDPDALPPRHHFHNCGVF